MVPQLPNGLGLVHSLLLKLWHSPSLDCFFILLCHQLKVALHNYGLSSHCTLHICWVFIRYVSNTFTCQRFEIMAVCVMIFFGLAGSAMVFSWAETICFTLGRYFSIAMLSWSLSSCSHHASWADYLFCFCMVCPHEFLSSLGVELPVCFFFQFSLFSCALLSFL